MEQTFCFVDLAGFSALTEAHGDDTAADLVLRFTGMVERGLQGDGELIAVIGDAVFVASNEPKSGLRVLRRLWQRAEEEPEFPALRAGLHHGEAVRRGTQLYGSAVNTAARVAAQASGGQVLATSAVATSARIEGIPVTALGATRLKNLRDAVELFALQLGPQELTEAIDPVCRMRVTRAGAAGHLALDGEEHWFCSRECLRLFVSEHVVPRD